MSIEAEKEPNNMDKKTWLVIYKDRKTNEVFGWFCKEESPSKAEERFWQTGISGCEIKDVGEFNAVEGYFALYGEPEQAAG